MLANMEQAALRTSLEVCGVNKDIVEGAAKPDLRAKANIWICNVSKWSEEN